mgnify:CR=1 FL=1
MLTGLLSNLTGVSGRTSRSLFHLFLLASSITLGLTSLWMVSVSRLLAYSGTSQLPVAILLSAVGTLILMFAIDAIIERIRTNRLLLGLLILAIEIGRAHV